MVFWRMGPARAVREKDMILIKTLEEDGRVHKRLLFDLVEDPMQRENLAGKRPEDVKRLEALLAKWESSLPEVNGRMSPYYRKNQRLKHDMNVIGSAAERRLP